MLIRTYYDENNTKHYEGIENGKPYHTFKGADGFEYEYMSLLDMITQHTDGDKMSLMLSVSSSPLLNPNCQKMRHVDGAICGKCFSCAMCNRLTTLSEKLKRNTHNLTQRELTNAEIQALTFALNGRDIFRFESFGDAVNGVQIENYTAIANAHPNVIFTAWTKRPDLYTKVWDEIGKPSNFILIYSDPIINGSGKKFTGKAFKYVDKIFTVYTADYAIENDIYINCGDKMCFGCRTCYTKNGTTRLNEILKTQLKKFKRLGGVIH